MITKKGKGLTPTNWLSNYKYFVVFVFAVLIYINTVPNEFCMDDELVTSVRKDQPHRLTSNGISAIPLIFTEPYYKDEQGYAYDYRPVVLTTFAIEHSLLGDSPHTSHFINVILYGLLCAVLLSTLCELFKSYNVILPFVSALIFAAHPIHTEVVASIKNRDEILALLFGLISILLLTKTAVYNKIGFLISSIFFLTLSIFSKPTSIPLVVLSPITIILFYRTKLTPLFVYILSGVFIFSVVSYDIPFITLLKISVLAVFFILLVYIVINYGKLIADFKVYINLLQKFRKDNLTTVADDVSLLVITVKSRVLVMICVVLFGVSFLLYFSGYPLYLLPITVISLCPFFCRGSNKWLVPVLHGLAIAVIVWETKNTALSSALGLQMIYMYFIGKRHEYLYSLLAYMVFCFTINEDAWKPLLGFFFTMYCAYETKWLTVLKYIPIIVILIVYMSNLSISTRFFLEKHVLSLDVVNVFLILTIAVLPQHRKYILLLICFQILVTTSINNTQTYSGQGKISITQMAEIATSITPPHIIDDKNIDRPIDFIESITSYQSPLENKLGVTTQVFRKYIQLLIVPYPMSFYYGYRIIDKQSVFEPLNAITIIFYGLLLFVALYFIRSNVVVAFSIMAYLVSISVYSNLFLTAPGMMADRFLFIPSLGFCILLSYSLLKIFKVEVNDGSKQFTLNPPPNNFKYTLLILLIVYSGLTIARNAQWRDSLTLFRHDIKFVDESAQAHNLLAIQLMHLAVKETNPSVQQEITKEALYHFKKAIEIYPPFFNVAYDIGRVYMALNQPDSAIVAFENTVLIDSTTLPSIYTTLSNLYISKNDFTNFERSIKKYIELMPQDYTGYSKLSYNYYLTKQYTKSIKVNQDAISKTRGIIDPYINISRVFLDLGRKDSALVYLQQASKIAPQNLDIQNAIRQLGN